MSNIAITIGANISNFVADMNTASNSVVGFDVKTRSLINTMAGYAAAATAAGAAVVAGLYASSSSTIDRQAKLARALDSSVESIQSVEYAADLAGVGFEELAASNGKLNRKLGEAITVGGAAAKELDRLGLSAKELSKMDANERLAAIADRIVELKYNSGQASASLKELGLKGNEMVAMMMDGGQQFRDVNKELRELNVLVSDTDAARIEAANDAWTKAQTVITGIANTLAVELSPYVQVVVEYLRDAAVESGGFKEEIGSAVKTGLTGFAKFADVLQGLRVVFKGAELVVVGFGAALISVFEAMATASAKFNDYFIGLINSAIEKSNQLLGTSYKMLDLPSKSPFMDALHDAANSARDKVGELRTELGEMAMQTMPSDAVAKYLDDVKKKSTEAAQAVVDSRKRMIQMPDENEETKNKKDKSNNILDGLRAGTEGMQAELDKRRQILDIYRQNTLAADAPYYAQQLNDILINEQLKQAELLASSQKEHAMREEQKAQNLERVAGDKQAMAAIIAEYDAQEILAEQIKQSELTQVQDDAQKARERLRYLEKEKAIDAALGLGGQLMSLSQGHSKRAFEFSKKVALVSAIIDGYRSATAAWASGMATGGPWAPAVAAAYTASSLLKTGALISSIKSTSFGSSSSASAPAGGDGGAASAASAGGASAAVQSPSQTMHVQGLDPNQLFTGAAVRTIAQGLLDFQKDGGKVVFNA